MTSIYSHAFQVAREAVGPQNHPASTLYVVATPIGNLADITLRALYVIERADTLACEDTRHTQQMLRAYGLDRSNSQLLAVHQHNEAEAAAQVIARLAQGQRVAYVSDAGTPAISDPGARLVAAVAAAGYRVMPLPGASSVTALLSASGMTGEGGFVFTGFLSSKATERQRAIDTLMGESRAVVLLEAPHRIEALAQALSQLGSRLITVGRELTKQFETVHTLPAHQLPAWFAEKADHVRGEFALVVHALDKPTQDASEALDADSLRTLKLLLTELPLKTAVKLTSDITGTSKNVVYDTALSLKKGQD
ncbi:16S rRNA (cytidine(1402)-2'-O)-methyltransferase [Limnohabitans sp. 103DPR2]|uniref:16S rRNA (cytidine(1402)-2'-O)-methyltransferase n=1 Tax=Limnohabitans sp. 103DPR2 TaxID=1678129 RepID=UPI0006DCCE4A|nr:16S rRNA (cytidine(1402)-2'-O)-methyltransferase [Limnohabitans sp. 103DPR2]ALK90847.1 Ribosomal RNA small subunit methyltransferase I [Limnohabitans sp. 103DPR2]